MTRSATPLTAALLMAVSGLGALRTARAAEPRSNWPQWRGPLGQGVSTDSRVPFEWSATENVLWKTLVPGRGHSQPIVWGSRVFLTTAVQGQVVPGAHAVKHVDDGKEFLHPDSMGADRKHAFKLLALDAESGKVLWERTAWSPRPRPAVGRSWSRAATSG